MKLENAMLIVNTKLPVVRARSLGETHLFRSANEIIIVHDNDGWEISQDEKWLSTGKTFNDAFESFMFKKIYSV